MGKCIGSASGLGLVIGYQLMGQMHCLGLPVSSDGVWVRDRLLETCIASGLGLVIGYWLSVIGKCIGSASGS